MRGKVRLGFAALGVSLGMLLWIGNGAATQTATLRVSAKADLFAAGLQALPQLAGGAGVLPPAFRFAAGPRKVLTFSSVSGKLNWGQAVAPFGPDGDNAPGLSTNIQSLGAISGMFVRGKELFLAGVFLTSDPPALPAPPRLRLSSPESIRALAPKLQQVFYIGDGRTSSGEIQKFTVPPDATRVYLGFIDAAAFRGQPGYYYDNKGTVRAVFSITRSP